MTTPQPPAALADEVKRLRNVIDGARIYVQLSCVETLCDTLENIADRLATLSTAAQATPAAWLHEDGERVITDQQKRRAITDGGASASTVAGYSIALATTAQAAEVAEQVRDTGE